MNQNTNQAWQGAAQVARARLQTIDQALAKLEAVVPDNDSSPPTPKKYPTGDDSPSTAPRPEANAQAIVPQPSVKVPDTSLQALEVFLEAAQQKRYMPKAV